jgi:hypothetical protein
MQHCSNRLIWVRANTLMAAGAGGPVLLIQCRIIADSDVTLKPPSILARDIQNIIDYPSISKYIL